MFLKRQMYFYYLLITVTHWDLMKSFVDILSDTKSKVLLTSISQDF